MKYEVEISTSKYIEVEAENEKDAEQKAMELPLKLDDFDWSFDAEEN